jgi:RNA polymerase sigma factor (sigma-70 family)
MATIPTATARMPPFSERGLMRAAARGERRAFEQIYRRYHQQLYRYCYAILRRESDAEDALQATMAAALRSLPGEKREVSLRSWLYRVAHNEAITLLRGRSKQADPEQAPEPARQSVEAEYAERERFEVILTDLGELPERQRSALVMRELSGLSYEEIGEALDCSGGAARQIVYESRVALQLREEGRTVSCEEIRRAVSDGDRRRLRGRKLKAHLSACESCRDFERGIGERRTTLQAFSPVLPAAAASSMLASLGGGSAAAGGAVGGALGAGGGAAGLFGGGLATATVAKGLSVAAAIFAAAGIGEVTGTIDVPVANFGKSAEENAANSPSGDGDGTGAGATEGSGDAGGERSGAHGDGGRSDGSGGKNGDGRPDSPGRSDSAPGRDGSPGKSDAAPGQDGSPGKSAAAPGQDGSPGKSPEAPGHDGTPGKSATSSGGGNSASSPGHDGSSGNSAAPPSGQVKPEPAPPPKKDSPTDGLLPLSPDPQGQGAGKNEDKKLLDQG